MVENLVTILVIALLLVFHRPLGDLAIGIFALAIMAVLLLLMFVLVKALLFGP